MRSLRERSGLQEIAPSSRVFPIVDAHHHLWNLRAVRYPWLTNEIEPNFMFGDYAELRRDYLPIDYLQDSAGQRVVGTVHCEAEADRADPVAETRWLAEQHAQYGFPNALVVWADLVRPDCAAQLEAHLAASSLVRGVRCKPRLPAPGSGSSPAGGLQDHAFVTGLQLLGRYGLSWDLRVPWWHLGVAAQVVARIPSVSVVLNHCGLPWQRDEESIAVWRSGMRALAAQPNVAVKVSELGLAERAWSEADNVPLIRETIETFGPARAIFGSNFPVARLRVDYDRWVTAVTQAMEGFSPDDRSDVFSRNAQRVYRIATTDVPAQSPRS
jgi:predicted TIM-barrel fold metal-dependent hydrolase